MSIFTSWLEHRESFGADTKQMSTLISAIDTALQELDKSVYSDSKLIDKKKDVDDAWDSFKKAVEGYSHDDMQIKTQGLNPELTGIS
jgi:hypothetical protein